MYYVTKVLMWVNIAVFSYLGVIFAAFFVMLSAATLGAGMLMRSFFGVCPKRQTLQLQPDWPECSGFSHAQGTWIDRCVRPEHCHVLLCSYYAHALNLDTPCIHVFPQLIFSIANVATPGGLDPSFVTALDAASMLLTSVSCISPVLHCPLIPTLLLQGHLCHSLLPLPPRLWR